MFTFKRLILLGVLAVLGGFGGWYIAELNSSASTEIAPDFSKFAKQEGVLSSVIQASPPSSPTIQPIPKFKQLSGGTHQFQTFNNCGPASLAMALSHYGVTKTQAEIGQVLRPYQHPTGDNDDKSVTLQELAAYAQEQGFVAYHRPAGTIQLLQEFIAADIPVITRTWLNTSDDIGHYRVVTGYDQNSHVLFQDDSLQGNDRAFTESDFLELWQAFNYEFLVIVRPQEQEKAQRILGELADVQYAWQQALVLADTQVSHNPSDIYAHFNRSVALHHLGRYTEAIAAFELVEQKIPSRMLWYQIEPILSYKAIGDSTTVLQMTQHILEENNRAFSELWYVRSEIFHQQQMTFEVEQALDAAMRYNSGKFWKVNILD